MLHYMHPPPTALNTCIAFTFCIKSPTHAHVHVSTCTQGSLETQYHYMRTLAASLSETIADKDLALTHMRRSNKLLGERVQVLEERLNGR